MTTEQKIIKTEVGVLELAPAALSHKLVSCWGMLRPIALQL